MMLFLRRSCLIFTLLAVKATLLTAQDKPIGYWESLMPYNNAVGVATDGSELFTIRNHPFFTYNPSKGQLEPYSKVEGMSDIGMQAVSYDASTGTTVLAYTDGNIDLFKNNTFYNIPDLKIKSIAGNKSINQIYCEAGIAYLSTSVGILVIDLNSHNILETYQFVINNQNVPINGFIGCDTNFYAITQTGLYVAPKSNQQLQNFQVWQEIDSTHSLNFIASVGTQLYVGNYQSVYALVNNRLQLVYTCPQGPYDVNVYHHMKDTSLNYVTTTVVQTNDTTIIEHIDGGKTGLLVSEFRPKKYAGDVMVIDNTFKIIDSCTNIGQPFQATQTSDNSIWIADGYYGLENRNQNNTHYPPGPSDPDNFDIYAYNKNVWVVHGGISDKLDVVNPDYHCASNYNSDKWTSYERFIYPPFNDFNFAVAVTKDQSTGTVYIGSFIYGLYIMNADGSHQLLGANSIFDSSDAYFGDGQRQVVGLALDASDNLWVTLAFSYHNLYVRRSADNTWYKFYVPGSVQGGPVTIDDNGNAWYVNLAGGGVVVYNPSGTFSGNPSGDSYYHLFTGVGSGNLPSNTVYCIAKDKTNNIWIGTDNGIGIVSNCSFGNTGSATVCDATLPIVQYDQFAGYLFAGNSVRSIAVDGANRKWIGTDNGVWLLSPDASKIIYRFTTDNSPIPSNLITKIAIDQVTGDVYIGSAQGLVTFHSTATDTSSAVSNVTIFPNPVPKDYTGTIAIRGLSLNADVRITDINDQLVYKTTALGSQAVWNGLDYKGHRPQTGVYLVFASSSDGSQTFAGKIVFMQ